MYSLIFLILLGLGILSFVLGLRSAGRGILKPLGIFLAVSPILLVIVMNIWGEWLWFAELEYARRFWVTVIARIACGLGAAGVAFLFSYLVLRPIPERNRRTRWTAAVVSTLFGLIWGMGNWDFLLRYLYQAPSETLDPVFELPVSFYLFSLPFYQAVYTLLIYLLIINIVGAVVGGFLEIGRVGHQPVPRPLVPDEQTATPLIALAGSLFIVLAAGRFLARYALLYSSEGVVFGAGWTDIHVRIPVLWIQAGLCLAAAAAILAKPVRAWLEGIRAIREMETSYRPLASAGVVFATLAVVWAMLAIIPSGLMQWLRVEPNELKLERPYIENNIALTLEGFGLTDIEDRQYDVNPDIERADIEGNRHILENIRLWDWRALDQVFKQFQEIRLYYEFADVDIDRYTIDGRYRQVMVSARELQTDNLPDQSQTFVNRRFKYTHGYGLVMTDVSDFTQEGLPNFLIQDIPPVTKYDSLKVERPEIYYGELTTEPVVANSKEAELDYPSGAENRYVHYAGDGGVPMRNLWRKFIYGFRFDGTRFFLSNYPTKESRMMFRRDIRSRVKALAPFLRFDRDPYVVHVDGGLYWIIDAYTTSSRFPYSEPYNTRSILDRRGGQAESGSHFPQRTRHLDSVNYIRNSVKCVVNAYDGSVDLYIFEDDDPLVRTWDNIFPGLFKPRDAMPEELEKHIRYPLDLLLIQGLTYAKYHMKDPVVFYNQEDLWIRATEKYHDRVIPVEPYYIMWEAPDSDDPEFVLIQPFTPKGRQVMIGWIAGMCDPENYGRLIAYQFPKEKRILGPQQVETKIDQDSYLSSQLTLWDQRGSNVIRGNVLAIPIGNTILYVEPIYLEAETAAYPELRLVVVMNNDNMSYAKTFDEALTALVSGLPSSGETGVAQPVFAGPDRELIRQANAAFERYLEMQANKRFREAADALDTLQRTLEQLMEQSGQADEGTPDLPGGM